jgi:hypothetical protein
LVLSWPDFFRNGVENLAVPELIMTFDCQG